MRILLFWPYFYPDTSGIACAKRGEAFAKYCSKKGIEVFVVVPKRKDIIDNKIDHEGYKIERLKTYNSIGESNSYLFSLLYFPISVTKLIKHARKIKPNIVISSTPGPFMPIEGLIVSKYLNIPHIFDMEDSWHLTKYSHKGTLRTHLKMFLERVCAIYSTSVFTVTPTLKQIVSKGYNIPQDKIQVVYNGVDLDSFPQLEKNEAIDLVHLGSPRFYYDTTKLIEAFSIIVQTSPETKLLFLGCSNDSYVQEIKVYAEQRKLLKNIYFAPPILHDQVPYELSKAKIGIISLIDRPEYKAAIGVKTFEYMSTGIPTAYLGPAGSEQEKIINENYIGISASNIVDFSEQVVSLIKDKKRREIMGLNAISCVKNYSWEKIINEAIDSHISPLVR